MTGFVPGAPAPLLVISAIVRRELKRQVRTLDCVKAGVVNQPQKSTRLRLKSWRTHGPT